ncbi:germinal-center associated nuclear protein isoform X2 [Oncorhynchus mykiss]|uniref:Germinal-center associated nuclear protein n=1 Tax=Oncorhynchus mykiss TaxID=8022 RepID=A0A8C7VJ48_ONCMY|nr:germinal-center associated nuclear protein isoform X2 [Oncorhynchus mykiss]XP_021434901.2 germinal-center associated nuclear protein isoform X2 [Oncorhynchus mykiss]
MNPNSLFGRQQGGAFQAPSNTNKTGGMFQAFRQEGSTNPPQNVAFRQTATFGQPSAFSQPSVFGQSPAFGQTPSLGQDSVFGQSGGLGQASGQTSTFSSISQPPAFGQSSLGQGSSGFSGAPPPSYVQATGQIQSSGFGQMPAFGQSAAFGQPPAYGQQQAPAFGLSSGISQASSGPTTTTTAGSAQPLSFGQSPFGQSPPSATTTSFATTQSVVQSGGFSTSEFSFKPSNEVLFKPIFSASPEPANPQPASASEQPFGGTTTTQPSFSTKDSSGPASSGFSLLTGAKSGPLGFSFSQPAVAPSISASIATTSLAQKDPLSIGSGRSLQFTFSQPSALSSTNSSSSTAAPQPAPVPSSPSSFSFSTKVLQSQPAPPMSLFGGVGFGQTSTFGDLKTEAQAEEKVGDESTREVTMLGRLGKGTKRKEEPVSPKATSRKPAQSEDAQAEARADLPRHPSKRPLLRSSRGPVGGLFSRAMSGIMKSTANSVRRDPVKEEQQPPGWGEGERADTQAPISLRPATPPSAQAPTREVLEKAEVTGSVEAPDPDAETKTPARRRQRSESTDSLGGMSPNDATILQCKSIPLSLNKKNVIEKHFGRFGKVCRVYCRPHKNLAIVHFQDHASAAKAKKKGKMLHRQEIVIFWQRKKHSPGKKGVRAPEGEEEERDRDNQVSDTSLGGFQSSSPLRKPLPRAPALSSTVNLSRSSPVKKPSIAKSLQFESEPQQDSSSEGQSSERPVPSSLLHLIGQLAETAEEKYRFLEQRDKILRAGRPKRTDLELSFFVGTCPDMCPEKERYMRETRNQLSCFEVVPDTDRVDHVAAIKEYSRSSADQEEPLPYELRPLPVLSMTMDYLVTQIMDQGHDNYRDWYDFVWNRTRGIRKDITQQHLCDPLTVSLIEKCTRFHVHCAHHLCQEHMMTFDAKINNENMTKCLQSLKEMYQDLSTRGVYCPQEAEFRQYNVLLKLDVGDVLREVQQFRDEVRNSPEVKFAVQAFAALNSNNFVRFFKLVKSASYLAGCLLHRYFNQVRGKALGTLNNAHTAGLQRSTIFPLEDLVRMLMFEDAAEATDFIQQFGLNVSGGLVELSRTAWQEPDLNLPQVKSDVIMAKRAVLIGEVVNGGPLPNPPQHAPVCSFDAHNKYWGEGPLAEPTLFRSSPVAVTVPAFTLQKPEVKAQPEVELQPQNKPVMLLAEPRLFGDLPPPYPGLATATEPAQPLQGTDETGEPEPAQPTVQVHPAADLQQQLFQPIDVAQTQPVRPPSPPPKPEPIYSDEDILAELECVVEEVLEAVVQEVASAGADYAAAALSASSVHMEAVVSEVVEQMLWEVSTAEVQAERERLAEEKRRIEEARRKQEHEVFLAQFSDSLCSEISQEVLTECIQETAASEIQLAMEEEAACVARCSEEVCSFLVEETLDKEIFLMVEDILEAELQRIQKYIKRWRDVVAVRRQLKRQMRGFPAAPCCVDPRYKLKALAPSAPSQPSMDCLARGMVNLGNAGYMALSSTRLLKMRQEAIHQMRVHFYYQQLLNESVWTPLDMPTLVVENVPNPPDRIFWKATLLLPSDHESVASIADRILTDWLETKFGVGESANDTEKEQEGTLRTLCITNGLREAGEKTHKVHISIKASRGPLSEEGLSNLEEGQELQGTGALLMLLPAPSPGSEDQDVPMLSALLQLKQLQQANIWDCSLPLAILVPGPHNTQKLEEDLMLQTLVEDGLISEHVFVHIPETTSDLQGSEQVSQAVRWLLARAPVPALLSSQTLVHFVEAGLGREFSARLYSHRQDRAGAGLARQHPTPVIKLYNAVLAFLADLVSSQYLSSLSWPPGEFALPETRDLVPHLGWNSPQHLAWLRTAVVSLQIPSWDIPANTASWPQLCSAIFQYAGQIPTSRHSQPLLMSRLENLLERVRCSTAGAQDHWEEEGPSFQQVPWDEVVALCIDHKLKDWQPPDSPVCDDAVTEDGEVLVYFPKEGLKGFQPPAEWTEAVSLTHREKQQETQGDSPGGLAALSPFFRASPGGLAALPPLRQKLFRSLVDRPDRFAPCHTLDITHTPSLRDLLPHKVLHGLQEERAHSQRCEEQLQRWLEVEPLDSLSMPLFMPSSLLSMTNIMAPIRTSGGASTATQEAESEDPLEKAERDWLKGAPVSMAQRLKELDRLLLASREEELACGLKLNSLLNIVED